MSKSTKLHAKAYDLASSPVFLLWRANNKCQLEAKMILGQAGLSYPEFVILATLAYKMNWTAPKQKHLAKQSQMDRMFVSQTVRSLQDKNLLYRQKGIIDGRANTVRITARGFNLMGSMMEPITALDERVLKNLRDSPLFSGP